jgi:hypothetical protein
MSLSSRSATSPAMSRHRQIQEQQIRLQLAHQPQRLVAVVGGADHLESGPRLEELDQTFRGRIG